MPTGWEKRQTDVTRRHFNVFVTTNCDTQPGYKLRSPPWTESHYLDAMQWPFPDWGVIRRQGADRPFSQQPPSPACQSSSQPGKSNVNPSNNPCLNSPNCFLLPPLTAQQPSLTLTRRVKSPLNDGWICGVSRFFFFSVDHVNRQTSGGVWVIQRRGLWQGIPRVAKLDDRSHWQGLVEVNACSVQALPFEPQNPKRRIGKNK